MTAPALLIQMPLDVVSRTLPSAVHEALGLESRLRVLLAHPALVAASCPVAGLRALAGATRLRVLAPGEYAFRIGDEAKVHVLTHGRVDLHDGAGALFATSDAAAAPPLGEVPTAAAATAGRQVTQPFTAVAAEQCYVLVGGQRPRGCPEPIITRRALMSPDEP